MQTRSSPALTTLHRMAEHANLPNWQNLSKNVLHERLQEQFDLERLQRASSRNVKGKRKRLDDESADSSNLKSVRSKRSSSSSSSSSSARKKKESEATFDPIMRCPLGKHVYEFVRPNGSCSRFNVESLVDYLIASGDFVDPESRLPFSDEDLRKIDKSAEKAGLKKKSVFAAKNSPENIARYADLTFRRDALLGLERCAGEVVTEMLYIVEECNPDEAEMRLLMREFPAFAEYYGQLRAADPDFAKQSMSSWKVFLKGPPNRPTSDEYGLLQIIQMFMRGCEAGTVTVFPP